MARKRKRSGLGNYAIQSYADDVERRVAAGDCAGAHSAVLGAAMMAGQADDEGSPHLARAEAAFARGCEIRRRRK